MRVRETLDGLQRSSILAWELHCKPVAVDDAFFSSRVDGISLANSSKLRVALRKDGHLTDQNTLRRDPRGHSTWRESLRKTGMPALLDDSLRGDSSAISEEMNLAWAGHEMCATFVDEMFDFCEDP